MESMFNSDIAKLEAEIHQDQLNNGLILDEKAYENKILTQEQEYLHKELETLRADTDELSLKLVDLQQANNFLEYRKVNLEAARKN